MAKMHPIVAGGQLSGLRLPEVKVFECGIHEITYKSSRAGCPVCYADREIEQMRDALIETKNKLSLLTEEANRMRVQVDIVAAMREAAAILDDADLAFLKAVLYEWRDTKGVGLKTTHGRKKGRGQPPANGFIAMPRKGDPYGHSCTSMGGLAIASYFDEATNTVGPAKAMEYLVKGMSDHLPGAVG